ncbi:trypsin-like peptidase domain-containing protein [Burkholderia pseudomallei]|uniref:trypsin-like peptidase domain-containing protein n=1 Tax=Burkholderia pseudomallei TaxID=28450 RepID=UPI001AAEA14E|nr:trypsin-like peptidase domain-containing protein [Burkholderia pseudomallei]
MSIINRINPYTLFVTEIEMRFCDKTLATGSCALITEKSNGADRNNDRHYILTAKHNLTGRNGITDEVLDKKYAAIPDSVAIWVHGNDLQTESWVEVVEPLFAEDEPRWLEHSNPLIDVAILPFRPRDGLFPSLGIEGLTGMHTVNPGDLVHVIGFPLARKSHGHLPIWNTGTLATDLAIDFDNLPCFLIDCTVRQGNSGSPVLYKTGYMTNVTTLQGQFQMPELRLLGIYTGRLDGRSDIGRAWKTSVISEILRGKGSTD